MQETLDAVRVPAPQEKPVFNLGALFFKPYMVFLRNFKRKVPVYFETGRFIIKTAETARELEEALLLRHAVFYKEQLNRSNFIPVDFDMYDLIFDHLLVVEKISKKVIGTYRVSSSAFSNRHYSETEFEMAAVRRLCGNKLELGRACIQKNYRNGLTLALLWKAVMLYAKKTNSRFLFGCSSIKIMDHPRLNIIFGYLKKHFYSSDNVRVFPRSRFAAKQRFAVNNELDIDSSYYFYGCDRLVPPLLHSYLKAGARICGEPAVDRHFKCVDFFTLLDLQNMTDSHKKKFL